jgi:diguanylate cyclase (GGDEF)-like protein
LKELLGERPRAGSDRALMRQVTNLLATDLSLGELFDRLTKILPEYLDSSVVFIALARPDDRHTIEFFYDHGEVKRSPHIELSLRSRAREVIRTGETIWGNDPSVWAPHGSAPIHKDRPWTNDTVSAIFVPMICSAKVVGCLSVQSTRGGAYTPDEVELIAAIGHYLGVALENQRMYQALHRTAEYDAMTGLASYSKVSRELDQALQRATSLRPVTVIVLDVVNFAAFNEVYGYDEGDGVLRSIGAALQEFEEEHIIAGRYGGDVFVVVMTESARDAVKPFVERLCERLRQLVYVTRSETIPISIACGYAVAPLDGGSRSDLVARCVDRARLSRRDCCRPAGSDSAEPLLLHGHFGGLETVVDAILDSDPFTRAHLFEVNRMAKEWSEYNLDLDRDSLAQFLQASFLHDLGKLLISDRLIVKPGRLTEGEYEHVKRHAEYGRDILTPHAGWEGVAQIVGQHHERWDGVGYPGGLSGEEIHPLARAVAVLDAYSAMVTNRPYHQGVTESAALVELQRCRGTQFDPFYVDRFVEWRESLQARQDA